MRMTPWMMLLGGSMRVSGSEVYSGETEIAVERETQNRDS